MKCNYFATKTVFHQGNEVVILSSKTPGECLSLREMSLWVSLGMVLDPLAIGRTVRAPVRGAEIWYLKDFIAGLCCGAEV